MISLAAGDVTEIYDYLHAVFVIFLRVTPVVALLPGFGAQSLSMRFKLMIVAALSMVIVNFIDLEGISSFDVSNYFSEIVTGLLIGLGFRFFVWALQIAGSIAAQTASLAQLFGSVGADPMPVVSHLLQIAGAALFVIMDLHLKSIMFLVSTYQLLPPGAYPSPAAFGEWGTDQISHTFKLAFGLAAPFVALALMYNLTMGAINKAMPQLMVAFVGAPLITLGSLVMILLSAPIMLSAWATALDTFITNPFLGR